MHHPASHWPSLVNLDLVAQSGQVVGGGQAAGTSADHQHPLAAGWGADFKLPVFLQSQIAEEAFDGVDADR